jgi:hypothetical protein
MYPLVMNQSWPNSLKTLRQCDHVLTYRVRSIFSSVEVHHAVNAGEGSAATLVAMRVELLLSEDITACLPRIYILVAIRRTKSRTCPSGADRSCMTYFARERHHVD